MKFLIVLAVVSALLSCRSDCHDILVPNQKFAPATKSHQSWKDVETYVYTDSASREFRYTQSHSSIYDRPEVIQVICEGDISNISYSSEYALARFTCDTTKTTTAYAHLIDFLPGEPEQRTELLLDQMGISVFNEQVIPSVIISQVMIVTSPRKTELDISEHNVMFIVFHDEITILGKVFKNVFEQKTGDPKLYYSQSQGIISFTDSDGTRLVLDRIE